MLVPLTMPNEGRNSKFLATQISRYRTSGMRVRSGQGSFIPLQADSSTGGSLSAES